MINPIKVYYFTDINDIYFIYPFLNSEAQRKFDLVRNKQFSNMAELKKAIEEILSADTKTWSVLDTPICVIQVL